jgi:hypothetical protein
MYRVIINGRNFTLTAAELKRARNGKQVVFCIQEANHV